MSLDTRIARARQKIRMSDLFCEPQAPAFPRVLSKNEYDTPHHNRMLCVHNKHYFTPCLRCGRDARRAQAHEDLFVRKLSQQSK